MGFKKGKKGEWARGRGSNAYPGSKWGEVDSYFANGCLAVCAFLSGKGVLHDRVRIRVRKRVREKQKEKKMERERHP